MSCLNGWRKKSRVTMQLNMIPYYDEVAFSQLCRKRPKKIPCRSSLVHTRFETWPIECETLLFLAWRLNMCKSRQAWCLSCRSFVKELNFVSCYKNCTRNQDNLQDYRLFIYYKAVDRCDKCPAKAAPLKNIFPRVLVTKSPEKITKLVVAKHQLTLETDGGSRFTYYGGGELLGFKTRFVAKTRFLSPSHVRRGERGRGERHSL